MLLAPQASRIGARGPHRGACHTRAMHHGVRRAARVTHGHSPAADLVLRFGRPELLTSWSASLPEQSTTSIALAQLPAQPFIPPELAGRRTVAVRYASIAGHEQAEELLSPMRAAATPVLDRVGELAYSDIGRIHDEPDTPVPVQQSQTLLSALPPGAIDALIKAAGPESGSPLLLVELRRLGGALARTPDHPSAFSHRHAPYALHTIGLAVPPRPAHRRSRRAGRPRLRRTVVDRRHVRQLRPHKRSGANRDRLRPPRTRATARPGRAVRPRRHPGHPRPARCGAHCDLTSARSTTRSTPAPER
ncbi:MAG: hypothetical protein QOG28_3772 [Trebonia sp.]|nr:hypothetical protein [Trebonia sp.]